MNLQRTSRRSAVLALTAALLLACSCGTDDQGGVAQNTGGGAAQGSGGFGGVVDGGTGASAGFAGACAVASGDVAPSPVDVIITIDQSASMGEETDGVLKNLNTNLVSVLKASGIDFRVVFVSSVAGLPTGPEYFQSSAGVNSSDALTLLLWTYDGNSKKPNTCEKDPKPAIAWKDKLRYEAQKVFIVVTDDDPDSFNCTNASANCTSNCAGCAASCSGYCAGFQCPTYADKPADWGGADFPTELYKLAPQGVFGTAVRPKWVMHSIVPVDKQYAPSDPVTPQNQVCNNNGNTGETSGVEYQKLSKLSGGLRFPSCDTDYSPVFKEIASTIIPLACTFLLEDTTLGTPDPKKTNVVVDLGGGGGPKVVPKDDTAPCEAGAEGWQFTYNNGAVRLCGSLCSAVQKSPNAKVSVTLGCDTQQLVK